jgi:hypothetical protein
LGLGRGVRYFVGGDRLNQLLEAFPQGLVFQYQGRQARGYSAQGPEDIVAHVEFQADFTTRPAKRARAAARRPADRGAGFRRGSIRDRPLTIVQGVP